MSDDRLSSALDRMEIRELIENWVLWRDAGEWDRLRSLWHEDGRMATTYAQTSAAEFVELCKKAWESGTSLALHALGGSTIDQNGDRAVAQTKMTITQRALLDGVLVDVRCTGRFYDFLERRNGRWGLVFRQPVYEMDRLDPVEPGATLVLDSEVLGRFPEGYRHLAYLQTRLGMTVSPSLPTGSGPVLDKLYAQGCAWLSN